MFPVLLKTLCLSSLLIFCLGCVPQALIASTSASPCRVKSQDYLLSIYSKSPADLAIELSTIDKQLGTSRSYCPALKLALIFSAPNTPYQNIGQSIQLFENILTKDTINTQDKQHILVLLPLLRQANAQQILINNINYSIQKHLAE